MSTYLSENIGSVVTVEEVNGKPCVSSLAVADAFGKRHTNILRDIENIECSQEFRRLNFEPSSYINKQGKPQPMFHMTRDGFSFLAMGFTGAKAAKWKEDFITLFNAYEDHAKKNVQSNADMGIVITKAFSQVLKMIEDQGREIGNQLVGTKKEIKEDILDVQTKVGIVDGRVSALEGEVSSVKEIVRSFEPRYEISKQDKLRHKQVVARAFHGKCPCCNQKEIIDTSTLLKKHDFHFEHYFSRARCRFEDTWIICVDCHKRVHNEKGLGRESGEIRSAFNYYQDKAKSLVYFKHEKNTPKKINQIPIIFDSIPINDQTAPQSPPLPVVKAAERVRSIVISMFKDGKTHKEIAATINRTEARVSQILSAAGLVQKRSSKSMVVNI